MYVCIYAHIYMCMILGFFFTGWIGILLSLPFICLVMGTNSRIWFQVGYTIIQSKIKINGLLSNTLMGGTHQGFLLTMCAAIRHLQFSLMPTRSLKEFR